MKLNNNMLHNAGTNVCFDECEFMQLFGPNFTCQKSGK